MRAGTLFCSLLRALCLEPSPALSGRCSQAAEKLLMSLISRLLENKLLHITIIMCSQLGFKNLCKQQSCVCVCVTETDTQRTTTTVLGKEVISFSVLIQPQTSSCLPAFCLCPFYKVMGRGVHLAHCCIVGS